MEVYQNGLNLQAARDRVVKEDKSELVPVLIRLHNMAEMIVLVILKNQKNAKSKNAQVNYHVPPQKKEKKRKRLS